MMGYNTHFRSSVSPQIKLVANFRHMFLVNPIQSVKHGEPWIPYITTLCANHLVVVAFSPMCILWNPGPQGSAYYRNILFLTKIGRGGM